MRWFKREVEKDHSDRLANTGRYTEHQLKVATTLVRLANGVAVSGFTPLLDIHPILESIVKGGQMEKWDFLLTVAGVGVAFSCLGGSVDEKQVEGFSYAIKQALDDWDEIGYKNLADFAKYFFMLQNNNTVTSFDELRGAVGAWVIFKLKEDPHSTDDIRNLINHPELFPSVGNTPCLAFGNFWNEVEKM